MSIITSCILLVAIILVCKYKNIKIEYMSLIYNALLFFLIYVFTENYKTTIAFILTILIYIFLIISLSFLERRKIRINFKEKIPLIFMIVTVILEEVFFRKIILNYFVNNFIFLIVGSLFFGAVHVYFSKKDVFFKSILGFMLSIIYIRTENLYVTLFLHLVYNLFVLKLRGENLDDKN